MLHLILLITQKTVSIIGILIILSGIIFALYQYIKLLMASNTLSVGIDTNGIRLNLGRVLILGLEFIVAADLIGTTTTPDYYSLGILASIVVIRTILNFTLNRELIQLSKEN